MAVEQQALEKALNTLKKAGQLSGLEGEENRALLLANPHNIEKLEEIAKVLDILQRAKILSSIQGQANYIRVMQNLAHIDQILEGLRIFDANEWLSSSIAQNNFDFIMAHKEHAQSLAAGVVALYKAEILEEYEAILLANPEYAGDLAHAIVMLHRAGLLTGEQGQLNLALLIKNKNEAECVARALYWLGRSIFLIQPHFDTFFRYPEFLKEIADEVERACLDATGQGLTETVFAAIIDSKKMQREERERAIFTALMPPVEIVVEQGFFKVISPTEPALPVTPLVTLVCEYGR